MTTEQTVETRELISNGSDACDRLRFSALTEEKLMEDGDELSLHVSADNETKTVTIRDNGIGMTRDEVIENIGTIARSGTRQFLDSLSGDQSSDAQLIGQFGVGFYSVFLVADKVELVTRRAGETPDQGVRWTSDGSGEYTIEKSIAPTAGLKLLCICAKTTRNLPKTFACARLLANTPITSRCRYACRIQMTKRKMNWKQSTKGRHCGHGRNRRSAKRNTTSSTRRSVTTPKARW